MSGVAQLFLTGSTCVLALWLALRVRQARRFAFADAYLLGTLFTAVGAVLAYVERATRSAEILLQLSGLAVLSVSLGCWLVRRELAHDYSSREKHEWSVPVSRNLVAMVVVSCSLAFVALVVGKLLTGAWADVAGRTGLMAARLALSSSYDG